MIINVKHSVVKGKVIFTYLDLSTFRYVTLLAEAGPDALVVTKTSETSGGGGISELEGAHFSHYCFEALANL